MIFNPTEDLMNIATHPIVSWFFPWLMNTLQRPTSNYILLSELFAPLAEAILLRYVFKLSWRLSLLASIFANIFSWWAGLYVAYAMGIAFFILV